jgi:hypothetical protein
VGRRKQGGPEDAFNKTAGGLGETLEKVSGDKSLEAEGRATRKKGELKTCIVAPHADGGWTELARDQAPSQLLVYKQDGSRFRKNRATDSAPAS